MTNASISSPSYDEKLDTLERRKAEREAPRHSPTPWSLATWNDDRCVHSISGADRYHVVNIKDQDASSPLDKANAAHIVRAVNCHDELVECLRIAQQKLAVFNRAVPPLEVAKDEGLNRIRAILAKAGAA